MFLGVLSLDGTLFVYGNFETGVFMTHTFCYYYFKKRFEKMSHYRIQSKTLLFSRWEGFNMYIVGSIILFVILSLSAALDGDFSGIEAIAKFVGFVLLMVGVMWLLTHPVLLLVVIALLVIIGLASS